MTQRWGSSRYKKRRRREIRRAAQLTVEQIGREIRRGGRLGSMQRAQGDSLDRGEAIAGHGGVCAAAGRRAHGGAEERQWRGGAARCLGQGSWARCECGGRGVVFKGRAPKISACAQREAIPEIAAASSGAASSRLEGGRRWRRHAGPVWQRDGGSPRTTRVWRAGGAVGLRGEQGVRLTRGLAARRRECAGKTVPQAGGPGERGAGRTST